MKDLFNEYGHKHKLLIKQNIEHFTETKFDEFVLKINEYLNDSKVYYDKEETALLIRLMEYRDNYIYLVLDFNLPFTNSLSGRGLRGIKSKTKVSRQLQI